MKYGFSFLVRMIASLHHHSCGEAASPPDAASHFLHFALQTERPILGDRAYFGRLCWSIRACFCGTIRSGLRVSYKLNTQPRGPGRPCKTGCVIATDRTRLIARKRHRYSEAGAGKGFIIKWYYFRNSPTWQFNSELLNFNMVKGPKWVQSFRNEVMWKRCERLYSAFFFFLVFFIPFSLNTGSLFFSSTPALQCT